MANFPSLYPLFMLNPFAGGGIGGGDIIVELMADPDITLEPEISVTLEPDAIDIELEPEVEIEVD